MDRELIEIAKLLEDAALKLRWIAQREELIEWHRVLRSLPACQICGEEDGHLGLPCPASQPVMKSNTVDEMRI